ncbi:MAG: hypothetical protein ACLFN4_05825, partial [Candidatus Acetothermia bacterium]
MKKRGISTFYLLCSFTFLIILFLGVGAAAQGTVLSLEDVELSEGESVTLYLILDQAIDGLGRLDASIVSASPQVLELKSVSPEAVADQFFQVDEESPEQLTFKMVDLGDAIDPGEENVQLVSFEAQALEEGEIEVGLEVIQYTDEEGNPVDPEVRPGSVTVLASEPDEESE